MFYLTVIVGALLTMCAGWYVNHTFKKYAKVKTALCGMEAAERILTNNGYMDIRIEHVSGDLTDHFNPKKGTVGLSDPVYGKRSVAAVAVAAHECGHVAQYEERYLPLKIRSALVPVANFGSNFGIWIVILSLIFGLSSTVAMVGVLLFSFCVLFQIITLPVEFNASARGLKMIRAYNLLPQQDYKKARKVLTAAALTYVASAASSILQLLRLIMIAGRD